MTYIMYMKTTDQYGQQARPSSSRPIIRLLREINTQLSDGTVGAQAFHWK